jgi:hypothetical protein
LHSEPLIRDATAAFMPGPNGEPSGMSAGAWAVMRALQHGHVARNSPPEETTRDPPLDSSKLV